LVRQEHDASIAIVGAGICGVSFLERIAASVPELLSDRNLLVYLVDPFPAGAGRVWRHDQSSVLQSNSVASNLTMFADDSVTCDGPIYPGPTLPEWAERIREGSIENGQLDDELREEIYQLGERSFPTRRLISAYLTWAYDRILGNMPPNVTVHNIRHRAIDVAELSSGQQAVYLADDEGCLVTDVVVLAVGHLDAEPNPQEQALAAFANEHDAFYLPSGYSADVDLSAIAPGEKVIVRGLGLAFVDLTALLTEGRGGRFEALPGGRLKYVASGREPVLVAGSRRGVPHHAKPDYRLAVNPELKLPRFFEASAIDTALADAESVDYARDLEPLIAKEMAWSYYCELFSQYPDRCAMSFDEFRDRFTAEAWGSTQMTTLIESAVPDGSDRLDLHAIDRPLGALRFGSFDRFQDFVRSHIAADLTRRADATYGADWRMASGFASAVGQLSRMNSLAKLPPSSLRSDVDGRLMSLYRKLGSGPPPARLRQLIALSEAGIVQFLGSDMWVASDGQRGVFTAGGANVDHVVEATALLEARLPDPTVLRTADPLITSMRDRGDVSEQIVRSPQGDIYERGLLRVDSADSRVLDSAGRPHPRRFALGPFTSNASEPSFIVPRTDAPTLRQNDATARRILQLLAAIDDSPHDREEVSSTHESDLDRRPEVVAS
jgi:uncharacterized NAD(P)/FAD-binding protein YdhS